MTIELSGFTIQNIRSF